MNQIKQNAINLINSLPDDVSWEDIIYEFYVREKIESAERFVEEGGKAYSIEETEQLLK